MNGNQEQSKRKLSVAVLFILLLVLVVFAIDEIGERAPLVAPGVVVGTVDSLLGRGGADPVEGFAASTVGNLVSNLPEGFKDELLDPGEREVFVSDEGRVVGVMYPSAPEEAVRLVSDELRLRGWKRVESGNPRMLSFVKKEGSYRWLFLLGDGDRQETCVTFLLSN